MKIAGSISGRQDRKSARGNRFSFVQVSDPTGLYEVTVFSDVLEDSDDLLQSGQNVAMSVEATLEAGQLKLLCRSVQSIDSAIKIKGIKGLKIFVNRDETVVSLASIFNKELKKVDQRSVGEVSLCLLDSDLPGEVEVLLGNSYPIHPEVCTTIKNLNGVISIEEY